MSDSLRLFEIVIEQISFIALKVGGMTLLKSKIVGLIVLPLN